MSNLPSFLEGMIANPPQHGEGVHQWLFKVARQLHHHTTPEGVADVLRSITSGGRLGRHVPDQEIVDAVNSAAAVAWTPSKGSATPHRNTTTTSAPPAPKWPAVDVTHRDEVVRAQGLTLYDLWEASPIRANDLDPDEIIAALFPADCLLCCGKSMREFATRPRSDWRGKLHEQALIVPSPMRAIEGRRKSDGQLSAHTLDNTGPRRHLVVEFDSDSFDEHTAILAHLSDFAPLVLAVHSAGKSLHGWFYVHEWEKERVRRFFRHAVELGADPATWTRSQFVRMPEGTRDNGKRQGVFFFNPDLVTDL